MGFSPEDIRANHEYCAHKLRAEKIAATPGGVQNLAVMRFLAATKVIHAWETIEWTNTDPVTRHTITLGTEPYRRLTA